MQSWSREVTTVAETRETSRGKKEKKKERGSAEKSEGREGKEGERKRYREAPKKLCSAARTTSLQLEGDKDGEVIEANFGAGVYSNSEMDLIGGVKFDL
jgi:hypothetical protein